MRWDDAVTHEELLMRHSAHALQDFDDLKAQADRLAEIASASDIAELRDLRAELESLRVGVMVLAARFEPAAPKRRTVNHVQRSQRVHQRPGEARRAPARAPRRGGLLYGSLTHPGGEEMAPWPEQA